MHAARTARQTVVEEFFDLTPFHPATVDCDPGSGRVAAFSATSEQLVARYAALVDLEHEFVDPADVVAESPVALPAFTLRYLYPSRYCQADLVQQNAWDLFGRMPRGYGQLLAVRDWVRAHLKFRIGASKSTTTAIDTLREGASAAFAHVMIAYCRALSFPARIVTGVDYGADPALGPPDFHAYVEVFLGSGTCSIRPEFPRSRVSYGSPPAATRPRFRSPRSSVLYGPACLAWKSAPSTIRRGDSWRPSQPNWPFPPRSEHAVNITTAGFVTFNSTRS